ncbi:hypothetical protein C2G38_2163302 [Gigaspora rosea]|uniref:Uncharacterized protein n=1 Tax=Gigaspora rosea TaxID=44941 RepID=A0A397W2G1_9GLOM|nr:hypothetical protein C2G38_2163302 [Gigaspora rosea]
MSRVRQISIPLKKNYNIDLSGQDKSGIKRKFSAIKRSTNRQTKASTSTKKTLYTNFQNKKPPKSTKSSLDKNDFVSDTKSTNESLMIPTERLEYEERMLLIEERKEKLRELRIANTIKEREHGLEQE